MLKIKYPNLLILTLDLKNKHGLLWQKMNTPLKQFLCSLIVAFCILVPNHITWSKLLDRIVAIVNDEVITLSELKQAMIYLTKTSNPPSEVKRRVLEEIINVRLTVQQAKKLGLQVKDGEVERAIRNIIAQNGITLKKLKEDLIREGSSYEDYKDWIKTQLLKSKLIGLQVQSKVTVTDEEIKKYYQAHIDEYKGYTEYRLRHILLPFTSAYEDKKQEILRLLKEGISFSELAQKYSQAPTAKDGGDLGWIKARDLTPEIRNIVTLLQPGEISPWIKTHSGFQLIQLEKRREVPAKTFSEVKEEIYRLFYQQKMEERYQQWLTQLREKAYIKILL